MRFVKLTALVLPLAFAGTAQAQVFTPTYMSPRMINELGVHLSDGPGDLAIEGIWRSGTLGLRVGYADAWDGVLLIGGELRTPLAMTGAPLGLAFTISGQGAFGDENGGGLQAGLTAGHSFMGQGVVFTPYLHPRVGIVNSIGPSDDWDVEVMADVGVDVEFYTNLVFRAGVNIGSIGGWGAGIAWRR
jgi:hypothetical protein